MEEILKRKEYQLVDYGNEYEPNYLFVCLCHEKEEKESSREKEHYYLKVLALRENEAYGNKKLMIKGNGKLNIKLKFLTGGYDEMIRQFADEQGYELIGNLK